MCYISLKREESESASPSLPGVWGGQSTLISPTPECPLFAPLHTLSGLLLLPLFFSEGGAFCVSFKIFLSEDQDRPKIRDPNVFALDLAVEGAAVRRRGPAGSARRERRAGGATLFGL